MIYYGSFIFFAFRLNSPAAVSMKNIFTWSFYIPQWNVIIDWHTHTTILRPSWILSGTTWICKSTTWPRHINMPASHRSVFYRPDALPATQPTASKHWRQSHCWLNYEHFDSCMMSAFACCFCLSASATAVMFATRHLCQRLRRPNGKDMCVFWIIRCCSWYYYCHA